MDGHLDFAEDRVGGSLDERSKVKMIKALKHFNWLVVAGIVVLAILLGVFNNLRVYEEQRVNWFGGPVVAAEE